MPAHIAALVAMQFEYVVARSLWQSVPRQDTGIITRERRRALHKIICCLCLVDGGL
jgi:hypothetical protein